MALTIGQQEMLHEFILCHARIGDAMTEIARQMTRANDIAERRINGEETNLGVLSEAVQSLSTVMEHGISNLTDVVTAYVGEIRIGLLDAADNDFTQQVADDKDVPDAADFVVYLGNDPDWQAESDRTFAQMQAELEPPLPKGETI